MGFPNGTTPAPKSGFYRHNAISLVLNYFGPDLLLNAYCRSILNGSLNAAAAHGQRIVIETKAGPDEPYELIQTLLSGSVDGAVLFAPSKDSPLLPALVAERFPFVVVSAPTGFPAPHVHIDDTNGAQLAMDHLYSLGHRRIGHLAGPLNLTDAVDRLAGFGAFCRAHDLPVRDHWVQLGKFTYESGYQNAHRILAKDPPTAVFAANDAMALGCIVAAKERGLSIPQDLSIVGFDDDPESAFFSPALTTVRQPTDRLASTAVATLVSLVRQGRAPEEQVFETELVVRASTIQPA